MSVRRRGPPRLPSDMSSGKRTSWKSRAMPPSLRSAIELKGRGRVDRGRGTPKEERMSHTPNQLDEASPGRAGRMHALKTSNSRFARLIEEYNELNREIHRVETRVEPTSEDVEEELKRRRV